MNTSTTDFGDFSQASATSLDKSIYGSMNKLQMVSFTNCRINKPMSFKFMLKNLSGIKTSFKLNAESFEPTAHVAPVQKTEI